MAGKVLSMEIGQGMTRVVEIDYRSKAPKIYNAFSVETPKDMVQDGVITRSEDFIVSLKAELRKRDIRTDSVVFTVASSRIANREARIPLCKEKEILPLITQNAADYFPVDMNQYHLVYNILGKTEEEGVKQYRLSLLAVPNDVTTSYLDLAHSLDLRIKAMDYVGNSVFQAVKQDVTVGTNAMIKIDEHSSLITIVKDGEIVLQRSIPHGVNGAIENVTELDVYGENLTYGDATTVFTQQRCLRRYLNVDVDYQEAEDTSDEVMMSRIMITENLRYFIGNVGRILEYYVSRNDNTNIENIYLVGIGADFVGMDELLSNELGYSVKKYTGLDNIRIGSTNFSAIESMRVYSAAIGASYAPLQLLSADLLKGEKETSLAIPIAIFAAGILTAATFLLVGRIGLNSAKKNNEELKKKIKDNEYLESVNETYKEAVTTYNQISAQLHGDNNPNKYLIQFVEELEQKMPSGFKAIKFSADWEKGVTIDVECHSKQEAALIFQQLHNNFETISTVSCSEFDEAVNLKTDEIAKRVYQIMGEKILEMTDQEREEYENLSEEAKVKVALEWIEKNFVSEHARENAMGNRVKPLEDGEEDEYGINWEEFYETTVSFSMTCIYKANVESHDAYMEDAKAALEKKEKDRAEALKLKKEKEAKEQEEREAKKDADKKEPANNKKDEDD